MTEQIIHCKITSASPLHIGCDEVYEPTSFVVDTRAGELVSFETASFLSNLHSEELAEFSDICCRGTIVSLLDLLRFMRKHAEQAEGERIEVPPAFIEHYESTLRLPPKEREVKQELNNFKIMRTAFDPLMDIPYIPGSAIKGAIRTAVLNKRNGRKKFPGFRKENAAQRLQEHLLGADFHKLETDPFRMLKISDFFPVKAPRRRIVYAVNRKKNPNKFESRAPYQILEIIPDGVEFIGSISLLPPPAGAGIRQPLTWNEILDSLRFFYDHEREREEKELRIINIKPTIRRDNSAKLWPLRVGRHSGAESVTVDGHRRIKIMQGKNSPAKTGEKATTVWLTATEKKPSSNSNLQPFGWLTIEQLEPAPARDMLGMVAEIRENGLSALRAKAAARKQEAEEAAKAMAARQREEEERKAKEEAAEKARQETEAKEKAAWNAMSEAERCAHIIGKEGTPENDVVDIYQRLGDFEPEDQKIIAQALKKYWLAHGKWNVKAKKKKQLEKVNKVKQILGET